MLKSRLYTGALCLFIMLMTGCSDIDSQSQKAIKQFGTSMDAKRAQLKLLPVPKNAQLRLKTDTSLAWIAKDPDACHLSKDIVYNKELTALVTEIDSACSPKTGDAKNPDQPDNRACLSITTTYSPDGQSISKQVFFLADGKKEKDISASEAEKLLTEWKLR
jgi:hypothetical protein